MFVSMAWNIIDVIKLENGGNSHLMGYNRGKISQITPHITWSPFCRGHFGEPRIASPFALEVVPVEFMPPPHTHTLLRFC